jgi:hypothetical protein
MADAFFSNVSLALHCEGADASTTFTDASYVPNTVTAVGNAQIDTAQFKFGSASALFDGTGDYLTIPNATPLQLQTGDFTIELWVRLNSAAANIIITQHATGTGTYPWRIWFESATSKFGFNGFASNGTSSYSMQQTGTSTTGIWYHLAAVRTGNNFLFFVDGAAAGTSFLASNLFATTATIAFGASNNGIAALNGWLDDIRITKGVARYTGAFTAPTATFDDFTTVETITSDTGVLQAPSVLGSIQVDTILSDTGVLQPPSVLTVNTHALISSDLLGQPSIRTFDVFSMTAVDSMLGSPEVLEFHDFTALVASYPITYVCDLITSTGTVRVPISSWQATLQTENQCYAGCVIPACDAYIDDIADATYFIIRRCVPTLAGDSIEDERVRAPVTSTTFDRGPTNSTCSMSGYFDAITTDLAPHSRYDRDLIGVRSSSSYTSGTRYRCAIDWLLRPATRALYADTSFVVDFINYYVPQGNDEYCDLGFRLTAP